MRLVAQVSAELHLEGRDAVLAWTSSSSGPGLTSFRILPANGIDGAFEQISKRQISGLSDGGEIYLEFRLADEHSVIWNGTDSTGSQVASGTYFYHLVAPGFTAARKMALIR